MTQIWEVNGGCCGTRKVQVSFPFSLSFSFSFPSLFPFPSFALWGQLGVGERGTTTAECHMALQGIAGWRQEIGHVSIGTRIQWARAPDAIVNKVVGLPLEHRKARRI